MKIDEYKWIKFKKGNLKDITIYTTEEYYKLYDGENADEEMITSFSKAVKKNNTVFDIGTFTGVTSLLFSKYVPNGKVVSFEPNPYNRERITQNFKKNPALSSRIKVYPYAISNENGKTQMLLSQNIEGPSSTSRISNSHSKIKDTNLPEGFSQETVEIITLDEFVKKNKIVPDIIKIDIEGAEHLMLNGAIETLKKHRPLLFIEIHSEFCAIKCYDILAKLGYKINILKEEYDNRIMIEATFHDEKENQEIEIIQYTVSNMIEIFSNKLNQLTEEITNLKETVNSGKNQEIEKLNKEISDKVTIIASHKKDIDNLMNSKSWKVTKPMRNLKKIFRRKEK